jgi:hypothetical protein
MVTILSAPLAHVPPEVVLESGVLAPLHTLNRPVIGAGSGLTVVIAVLVQPVASSV